MSGLDAQWIGDNFAGQHEFEHRRRAFFKGLDEQEVIDLVIHEIGLEWIDEAVSRAMYALGYDGDFEFDGLDEEDMTEEQIARYRRWYQ